MNRFLLNLLFFLIGIFLIYSSLTAPCNIQPTKTTQDVGGTIITAETSFPQEINLLLCVSTQPKLLIYSLVGFVALGVGATNLINVIQNGKR